MKTGYRVSPAAARALTGRMTPKPEASLRDGEAGQKRKPTGLVSLPVAARSIMG
ncbi:MAG TPA: hypothetical protein PK236_15030 [Verrucomicrobiota bacterium]|nr:hypothetical protein [Verrucomicrobiota bacterium]